MCREIFRDTGRKICRGSLLKDIMYHAKRGFALGPYESLQEMAPRKWEKTYEKIYIPTKTCTQTLIAALFIIAKNIEHIPNIHQLLKR